MSRPKKFEHSVVTWVDDKMKQQINELGEKYGLQNASVVRQAIARWHESEFPKQPRERRPSTNRGLG